MQCIKDFAAPPRRRVATPDRVIYSAAMDETADLKALASRYLDLWEDQIAALAQDPALSELFRAWMGLAAMGVAGMGPVPWTGLAAGVRGDGRTEAKPSAGRTPVGTTAAAAASVDRGHDLVGVAERLAALEKRLARLESGGGKRPSAAGGGSRKGKSGKPRQSS